MSITEAAGERRTAKADAMEFLQAALAGDPVPATEVNRMARERDLTIKAIRSAREALGVKIERNGFGPGSRSLWSLPGGRIEAPPSDEKVSASREEPNVSENRHPGDHGAEAPMSGENGDRADPNRRPRTKDGFEVIGPEPGKGGSFVVARNGLAPFGFLTGSYRAPTGTAAFQTCQSTSARQALSRCSRR
jgi:hypothetical protein